MTKINYLKADSTYLKNATLLPPESSITQIYTRCFNNNFYSYNDITSQTSIKKLWKSYKSEYASLSDSDKLSIATSSQSVRYGNLACYSYITVGGSIGVNNYENIYPITAKMPKTTAIFVKMLNAKNKVAVKSLLSSYVSNSKLCDYCAMTLYNDTDIADKKSDIASDGSFLLTTFDSSNANSLKRSTCFNILLKQINNTIDLTKPFVCVSVASKDKTYSYYQALSDNNARTIKRLTKKTKG